MTKIIRLKFTECEHNGDLDNYKTHIINSGGKILDLGINYDIEEGYVVVEIKDNQAFNKKFVETDAYYFLLF